MSIEKRSVDFITEQERFGQPSSLFYVWFGANTNITTLATGALPVVLGLNLFWSAVSIVAGQLIGAIFMASHSAQGPKLGIPQMIQSRAQFGVLGAVLPLLFVMLIYLGFFISNTFLAVQIVNTTLPVGRTASIILVSLLCFLVAVSGYKLIHKLQKILSLFSIAIFAVATILALSLPMPAGLWSVSGFSLSKFLLALSIAVTWQLSYGPYVADYSRYLPEKTAMSQVFWYSYIGTVLGGVWMTILGAILSVAVPHFAEHVGTSIAALFGWGTVPLYIFMLAGLVAINVFNLYGAFMSTVTVTEPFYKIKVTARVRIVMMLIITAVATVFCMLAGKNFVAFFIDFILFMSYFLIPWTAINLVDFYFIRHGIYSVKDIFDLNGKYGRINYFSCITFIVAIALEIPFMNTELYVGPLAKALGGVDLAWVIGLVFPAAAYYLHMKGGGMRMVPKTPSET